MIDEHPGHDLSECLAKAFALADRELTSEKGIYSGTTAVVTLLQANRLYTANVGDSRAVLRRAGKGLRLTYDHKGSDPREQARVRESGGFILNERVSGIFALFILGMLAVTRALGDSEMKEQVAGDPFCTEIKLGYEDDWLILACDGLWDVCTDQEAVDYIAKLGDAQEAAEALVDHALDLGSADNLSVICVRLTQVEHDKHKPEHAKDAKKTENVKQQVNAKGDEVAVAPIESVETKE